MASSDTFYSVLQPIYYVGRAFGLVPFSVKRNGITKSKIGVIWCLLFMAIVTSLATYALAVSRVPKNYGILMQMCDNLTVYSAVFSVAIIILCNWANQQNLIKVLKYFIILDEKLIAAKFITDLSGIYQNTKKWTKIASVLLTIYFLLSVITNVFTEYTDTFDLVYVGNIISSSGPSMVLSVMELEFCVIVLLFKQRFRWLNNHILKVGQLLAETPSSRNEYSYHESITRAIATIKYHHQQLYSTSIELNNAFSLQMLLLIASAFLNSIMTLFYWSITSVRPSETLWQTNTIFTTTDLIFSAIQICFVVVVCSQTASEAQRTGALVHYIMPTSKVLPNKKVLQIQLSSFSLQLADYSVNFIACSVFPINETLVYTIVGTAATYLIIVIQFELLEMDGKSSNASAANYTFGINSTFALNSTN